jgi:predicted DNA-binding transcriptional regulator AlpA
MTAMTIDDFCDRYRISKTCFYELRKKGGAPRVIKIGKCARITEAAAAEWIAAREAVAA